MAKDKKQPRPRAETPKGFRDYFGAEVTERSEMLRQIAVQRLSGCQIAAKGLFYHNARLSIGDAMGMQTLGQIKGLGREFEALAGVFGKQQHVFGVAMRSVGTGQQIRLLGACRHAG